MGEWLEHWPRLFKHWLALSTGKKSIQWIEQLVSLTFVRWIVIYPEGSAIQRLNNRSLDLQFRGPEFKSCSDH